ncbi:JAB domain-containing protein [Wolbachia pipientis]|nr:JAB domain-containing protein [Wolbachia pipientis]MDM8334938.1 JAB domain-containing protein [Wolbachia pipientis]
MVGSTSIVISHNHPGRDTQHSNSVISLTRQLTETCKGVEIELIDHIYYI